MCSQYCGMLDAASKMVIHREKNPYRVQVCMGITMITSNG